MLIKNSHALITGSSSGIGAATALALARAGCHVAVTWSKDKKGGEKIRAQCASLGVKALLYQLDVRDDGQCQKVVRDAAKKLGGLDIVVNSAGMTKPAAMADLSALSAKDFLDIYEVNLVGVFQVVRAAAPYLRKSAVSHVVSVASMAAFNGRGSSMAYAASKGALVTLTKSLARVLGPQVRVNAVCPGLVEGKWAKSTLGARKFQAQVRAASLRSTLKAVAKPEDIAAAILACISGCDLMTGTTLFVDGGAHLGTAHLLFDDQGI